MKDFTIKVINIWTGNTFRFVRRFPSVYYADRYASRLYLKASKAHSPYTIILDLEEIA